MSEEKYVVAARKLADQILAHFADLRGGLFDTRDDREHLVLRPQRCVKADGVALSATPSGSARATMVLFKLAADPGEGRYVEAAERAVTPLQPALTSFRLAKQHHA